MPRDRIVSQLIGGARPLLRRLSLVVVLALLLVPVGFGGSASAAVAGLQRVAAQSASDSTSPKTVTASCPAGKRVLGVGAEITGAGGQVVLDDLFPDAALTTVTVTALEDETGTSLNWSLGAHAICAPPLPGLERVVAASPTSSAKIKSLTASCPAGKRVLGVGAEIAGGVGQVVLDDLAPNAALTSVTVTAIEDGNGTTASWRVRAFAICATPPAGLERVSVTSASNSDDSKFLSVNCPAGKQPLSAGGDITGGVGQVMMTLVLPLPGQPTDVFVQAVEDETGTAANWSVTAFAICAPASQRLVATSATNSTNKNVTATCPVGQRLTGAGGDVTGGLGQVVLDTVRPSPSPPTSVTVRGAEDETGFAGNWSLRAYAICATPLAGLERVLASSPTNSSTKGRSASCPVGKQVVGAGGEISNGFGQVVLDDVRPDPALTNVIATGIEDETGFAFNWRVDAFAICATPPPGLELVSATTDPDSDPASGATASCPPGKNLLGAGGEITGGVGQVAMDDVRPNALLTNVAVTGLEDENGFTGDWTVTAHAICASL